MLRHVRLERHVGMVGKKLFLPRERQPTRSALRLRLAEPPLPCLNGADCLGPA